MYWILFVMGTIAAVVIALIVGGLTTPRAHVASRIVRLRAAPETVWALVRDVGSYASWRPDVQSIVVDGAEWEESSPRRSMRFGITQDQPPVRFGMRMLDDDLPYTGEWLWEIEADGDGSRVTLTERGEVGNPVFRFIGTQMIGHTRSIDAVLRALAIRVGDAEATIEDAPVNIPATARP
ncbi:MAG: SRPBCC family protein [Gemmatimonadota bacterium]